MSWKTFLLRGGLDSDGQSIELYKGGDIQTAGRSRTPDSTAVTVFLRDDSGNVMLARGTSVPGDETGFAKGCIFIKTDAADGTNGVYENIGTTSSADFNLIGAISAGEITLAESQYLLGNASGVAAAQDDTADALLVKRMARATFDFAVDGGSTGAIGLGVTIPDNAIITRSWYEVLTTFTSPTSDAATIQIGIPTDDAAGIVAAVDINDGAGPWDAGYHEGIQDGAAANFSEKTTAARELTLTIGVEDITAGALVLFCEYVVSD